ncbi:MAG: hypothetical protein BAJALOKI2v1_1100005 [Promethearchaeota archaeon]|nr:MAG: hypothetical protein BAJALOKI2v1_1100005 [Candidatus Lokiarchaeota archaeon]
MVVREAGILFRGYTLVSTKFHQTGSGIDDDLRSGFLTAIVNFAENAFSSSMVEYLEGNKYTIAFKADKVKSEDSDVPEPLFAFCILDKEKNMERVITKNIHPLLEKTLDRFLPITKGKSLSEISQFKSFRENIKEIFEPDAKTLDQKLERLFY